MEYKFEAHFLTPNQENRLWELHDVRLKLA